MNDMLDGRRTTTANSGFAIAGVPCFYESEVPNQTFVLRMKFSGKNRQLLVAANRYSQCLQTDT